LSTLNTDWPILFIDFYYYIQAIEYGCPFISIGINPRTAIDVPGIDEARFAPTELTTPFKITAPDNVVVPELVNPPVKLDMPDIAIAPALDNPPTDATPDNDRAPVIFTFEVISNKVAFKVAFVAVTPRMPVSIAKLSLAMLIPEDDISIKERAFTVNLEASRDTSPDFGIKKLLAWLFNSISPRCPTRKYEA
jgi:hypothetical protein